MCACTNAGAGMDKIRLLKERKEAVRAAGKAIRAQIAALVDADSFVELEAFRRSKDAFYEEDARGEGVITGFATIGGDPFYVIAQNFDVCCGGFGKKNCEKIIRAMDAAVKAETSVVYLLNSYGVRVGEGVEALEGIASVFCKAAQLSSRVLQAAIVCGEAYGPDAVLASFCDVVFFTKESALCTHSPLVLSAKDGKSLSPAEVGGFAAVGKTALPAVSVKDIGEAADKLRQFCLLVNERMTDADLNTPSPELNRSVGAGAIAALIEDGIELGANGCASVRVKIGRIGGISAIAMIFDGLALTEESMRKVRVYTEYAKSFSLPLVLFVDCIGTEQTLRTNDSALTREIGEYLYALESLDSPKIAVVTRRAIGMGYTLFAAKAAGFHYTFAFADAQISLFESAAGAQIVYPEAGKADAQKLRARYEEELADPIGAAESGNIDDVIEPQFVKQYLTAALQTLVK